MPMTSQEARSLCGDSFYLGDARCTKRAAHLSDHNDSRYENLFWASMEIIDNPMNVND